MADQKKKECGCFVVMKNGKRYLFEVGASSWLIFKTEAGTEMVRVIEKNETAFEAPLSNVDCIGGHSWFFKDAWWGKQ